MFANMSVLGWDSTGNWNILLRKINILQTILDNGVTMVTRLCDSNKNKWCLSNKIIGRFEKKLK